MPDGYCEPDDVRRALQETDLSGSINTDMVETAIKPVSDWLRRQARAHWYDSGGADADLVPTSPRSVSTLRLDVPSSPHPQDRQLHTGRERGHRYPVTVNGPYAKIRLPYRHVESVDTLEVRDRDGDVTDWTAVSDKTEGRGEDYYAQTDGRSEYGLSYLYVRAASIGPRVDFDGLLSVGLSYGLDAATDTWQDVRRGVALLVAAQLVTDDDVLAQIPENARLAGIDTQRSAAVNDALSGAVGLLQPYLAAEVR